MPSATSAPSSKTSKPLERSYSNPVPRKRRVVKRRGRGRGGDFESDEEIEREVRTDSETDDDHTSIDSDSDSESSSSELHADAHSEVITPSTTQSPPPVVHAPAKDPSGSHAGIFADASNWAEMVAGEAENGTADLPVIDFADMDSSRIEPRAASPTPRPRKSHKTGKKAVARATSEPPPPAPAAPATEPEGTDDRDAQSPVASTSHASPRSAFPSRGRGQTARQAYQQRLETDPSFVPKVGEFWGHDDRLLDKDLRSLSGWWRGRWQSRGRGRGGFGMRGRGRGFYPGPSAFHQVEEAVQEDSGEVPPVDRPWTHDGFEEMKRKDERRRAFQERQQQQPEAHPTPQRGFGFRGRGFVPARGRGSFVRGGAVSPTTSARPLSSSISMGERVWYAQKPDKMWTKLHDIFLYSDHATKPRPGVGQGVKVKLPGGKAPLIVRLPPRSAARVAEKAESVSQASTDGDKLITVRIPSAPSKTKVADPPLDVSRSGDPATTVDDLPIEAVFTVRPDAVANRRVDLSLPPPTSATPIDPAPHAPPAIPVTAPLQNLSQPVPEEVRHPIEQLAVLPVADERTSPSTKIQETILRNPPSVDEPQPAAPREEQHSTQPPLHPLQTSFSPVPPPVSPPYGSPYAFAPALPPGVAVNHQGMPYEYATGRPVYIQPTPPPMYTPRPMMHGHHPSLSMPFVPSHLRHHSTASPDFLAQPHTPHTPPIPSFVDPATGLPIFSPARQTSRIEIRAPTEGADGKRSVRPSHPRSNLSTSIPFSPASVDAPAFVPQQFASGEVAGQRDVTAEALPPQPQTPPVETAAPYAPYHQQYYYPEQYGYTPYMDMPQQMVHYEMYQAEQPHPPPHPHHQHHPSQPIVYY